MDMYDAVMPRIPRVVVAGCAHHVTQRGNRREDEFFTDEDRQEYLSLSGQYAAQHGLATGGRGERNLAPANANAPPSGPGGICIEAGNRTGPAIATPACRPPARAV